MSLIRIHNGNSDHRRDPTHVDSRSSLTIFKNTFANNPEYSSIRSIGGTGIGRGACKSGKCASVKTPAGKVRVEQYERTGPGWKQKNLKFTDPKSGQSVKPDNETFSFLSERGYKPKQEKGSTSVNRSYCWRKPGSDADISPTTISYLGSKSDYVMVNF